MKVLTRSEPETKADCIVVGVAQDGCHEDDAYEGTMLANLDEAFGGYLLKALQDGEISAKKNEATFIHSLGKIPAKQVLIMGLGKRDKLDFCTIREVSGRVVKACSKRKLKRVVVDFTLGTAGQVSPFQLGSAVAEGVCLAAYRFEGYRRDKSERRELDEISIVAPEGNEGEVFRGIKTGAVFAAGTNLARDLVNTPANLLTPRELARKASDVARTHGMDVKILERKEMEELGMGALLAVARGSRHMPKMAVIRYQGRSTWEGVIGWVGKGITFDSGGISLKPASGMEKMGYDMAGAAAVIGALDVIGRLKPKVNILAVIPIAENMPSGNAYRPGDVLPSMSGRTIEVVSTDAEGRLILADAITYAKKLGARVLVDVATLTGAVTVALGTKTTAAIANHQEWLQQVKKAAEETGELVWELPAFDVYREQYKSRIADLKNSGGRNAGTITAGMFLGEFAEETPWVHLDIAGTAWTDQGSDLNPAGGTGVMVRTLARLALNHSNVDLHY